MPSRIRRVLRSSSVVGIAIALALGAAACESHNQGAPIRNASAEQPATVTGSGRIIGVQQPGSNPGSSSGIGAIGGGLAGGFAGAALGHGRVGILTGIAGALGGALLGNAIERGISSRSDVTEFVIERDDGQIVNVQQQDNQDLQTGDRVNIIQQGGKARVVRAPGNPTRS